MSRAVVRSGPEGEGTAANDALGSALPMTLAHGAALLERAGLAGLRAALAQGEGSMRDDGWTLFWRGYSAQFDDLRRARAEWLRAEESFARIDDRVGLDLVACGLVQGVQLDDQSYSGHAARADRVARMENLPNDAALSLFVVGARIVVASERDEFEDPLIGDIERAFGALGSEIDPNIRLRCACAAVQVVGRMFDRGRSDDFYVAGGEIASRPEVTDYSRALWHLLNAISRWYDAGMAPRALEELAAIDRLAPDGAGRPLLARAHLLRALLALNDCDAPEARARLDAAHRLLVPDYEQDYALFHLLKARHALLVGDFEAASALASLSLRKCEEAQAPKSDLGGILTTLGTAQTALRQYDRAAASFALAVEQSAGVPNTLGRINVHMVQALARFRLGVLDEARAELMTGLALARSVDLTHFFRSLPSVAAELCAAALDLDTDPAFVRKVIAVRRLASPDPGVGQWPWSLRLRLLGGTAIDRDGEQLKIARKAPKRLIDLVRLIAALGGRRVDAARVAATLWPEADGDVARDSLKTILHRARALLGADALQVRDGQISFDEGTVWLDTWALEHVSARIETLTGAKYSAERTDQDGELARRRLQLLALYRGHFLGEGEVPAWAMSLRDRLRARFVRSVELLGQRLERTGRQDESIHLYRAALEQDNLAEELYQHLIECHLARGEHAQALGAYRRCRELLSIVLGLRPSARTEALVSGMRQT